MQIIEQMLIGKLPMSCFTQLLQTENSLQNTIRRFVPTEAVNNPDHSFWNKVAYSALERYGFDYLAFLFSLSRFDGTIADNYNIFSLIKIAYEYYKPDINYTNIYRESHEVYLDAVGEYFEGPEVMSILNQLVSDVLPINSKRKRAKILREKLKETFHVKDNKKPHWIQGGEWPMGKKTPMQYVGRVREKDGISYTFFDVDTSIVRTIKQYY